MTASRLISKASSTSLRENDRAFQTAKHPRFQRKCGCGGTPGPTGECESCRKKRLSLQRHATNQNQVALAIPSSVHEVLRSSGEPISAATRAFMEPRFGHDFGRVRIHTDARASESARMVNAEAYTVGQHIVFGTNRYAPDSSAGRNLLAHELTHTLQQGDVGAPTHISDPDERSEQIADLTAQRAIDGPPVSDSPLRARLLGGLRPAPTTWIARKEAPWPPPWHEGVLKAIARFAGPSDGKSADNKWPKMRAYLCQLSQEWAESLLRRWSSPSDKFSRYISEKFPANHKNIMSILAEIKGGKSPALCLPERSLPSGRAMLEESLQKLTELIPEPGPTDLENKGTCGPNITEALQKMLQEVESTFAGADDLTRGSCCQALYSLATAFFAWDIQQLRDQGWIATYQGCAKGDDCDRSVQVTSQCHYAGSVNYVLFGKAHRLCYDYYKRLGVDVERYHSEEAMKSDINKYKGTGLFGLSTPAANFEASKNWAVLGYHGFKPTRVINGDRPDCAPTCRWPYMGGAFKWTWVPLNVPKLKE